MSGLKAASAIIVMALGGFGSTCHQASGGAGGNGAGASGEASKDNGADVTLAGVDTSALTPREKKEWSSYVSELLAPCSDVPVPIAQCVQEKRSCSKCLPAARFVLKGVRDGMSREQIEKSYHNRFDADRIKNVPIDGSPSKGPDSAPVTIVEFADFECPFCAMEAPILEKAWSERKNQIRFVFKFFPLSGHPHGESAARAGIAAINQGKFWEMHDRMFANREHLEQSDLDSYAKDLGMDLARFHADMQSPATTERIAKDKKVAESLGVSGTPTIYINGRDYDPHQDLNDWLALELGGSGAEAKEPAAMPVPGSSPAKTAGEPSKGDAGAGTAKK